MIDSLHSTTKSQALAEFTSSPGQSLWRGLYLQAIFEPERTKTLFRIQEAERAMIRREHELSTEPNSSSEREAIINALHCLEALRQCSKVPNRERAA